MGSAISIENLSKQYRLGVIGTGTLTYDLKRWWALVRRKEDPTTKIGLQNKLSEAGGEFVWALRNINLEVRHGEVMGIIGKNGAGKSTLLKILSRVTSPTTGMVQMNGRVASLLEVGTGFHYELTGRENVFLNGAIMGMSKREVRSKFDEIVDFSGIEKYIDTPVKRYSSGMFVRLAFAVAAHLDPEILIVDEVLAVGDAEFQKKAIGKMQDSSGKSGRTVLFVSHNMGAIQNLCNRAILLDSGSLLYSGNTNEVIKAYLNLNLGVNINRPLNTLKHEGIGNILFSSIEIKNNHQIATGSDLALSIRLENSSMNDVNGLRIDLGIDNSTGTRIAHLSSQTLNKFISIRANKVTEIVFNLNNLPLLADRYSVTLYCEAAGQIEDWIKNAYFFDVENADFYKTGKLPPSGQGNILLKYGIEQL